VTNFEYIQKTIDLFEDSLAQGFPITTVRDLSSRIGYSPHHLNRLFQTICGLALGQYVIRRRLSFAVGLLSSGSVSARDAAQRSGWDDYSAFSRAFRREFGHSPGVVKSGGAEDLNLLHRARPVAGDLNTVNNASPVIEQIPSFHVSGLVFFMGPSEKTFHRPWSIFARQSDRIRGRIGDRTWQLSSWSDDSADVDDGLWIHCAVQTDPDVVQDPVFFSRWVESMTILRFMHSGPIENLYATYHWIWHEYLPRSTWRPLGNFEYQRYGSEGEPVEICVPVSDSPVP